MYKISYLLFVSYCLTLLAQNLHASDDKIRMHHNAPRILLTGFQPLMSKHNSSYEIAETLLNDSRSKNSNTRDAYKLFLCPAVPNSFQNAVSHVMNCVKEIKPDIVISLGESGYCSITVETAALNLYSDHGTEIDGQLTGLYQKIDSNNSEWWKPLRLPFETLYSTYRSHYQNDDGIPFMVGNTPSNNFVCNKLAYDLETTLSPLGISFGFIHVPSYSCKEQYTSQSLYRAYIANRLKQLFLGLNKKTAVDSSAYKTEYELQYDQSIRNAEDALQNTLAYIEHEQHLADDLNVLIQKNSEEQKKIKRDLLTNHTPTSH